MLIEKLRAYCHDDHEALHVHPLLGPLQGEITLDQYKAILAMFHAAYRTSETHARSTCFVDSPVMEWLERDMQVHRIAPLSWSAPALSLATESELVGYLYVKQGSTLGGQFISKKLQESLGLEAGVTNHFFSGYGAETGAKWRQFKDQLAQAEDRLDHGLVLQCAKRSFETIRDSADRMLERPA